MKKIFLVNFVSFCSLALVSLMTISCSSENDSPQLLDNDTMRYGLTKADLHNAAKELDDIWKPNTRASMTSEEIAIAEEQSKEVMEMFIKEGKSIQQQVLCMKDLSPEDSEIIVNLTDDELAYAALVLNTAHLENVNEYTTRSDASQAMSCGFSAVTGLSWSGGLAKAGAKMVAKAALKAAAKTLCGGVGVALTVVSFFDCMDMI